MKIKEMIYQKDNKMEMLYYDKYKNYNYYILNLGTHPTAYIAIPLGNKLYAQDYTDIYEIGCDINVHGGLTYSSHELMGISSDDWFIGWDYAHCTDYCVYEEYMPESLKTNGKKWTTEEIIDECKNAIDQIVDFENKEILEEKKIPEKLEDRARFQYSQIPSWFYGKELIKTINENFEKHQKAIYEIIDYLKRQR